MADWLTRYVDRPFQWGQDDCSLWLADWYMHVTGRPDPAAHLRGVYSTEEEKRAVVETAGGIIPLVAGIAEGAGCVRVRQPSEGCIGIVPPGVGAIYTGGYWVVRTETGFAFLTGVKPWRVWSIS